MSFWKCHVHFSCIICLSFHVNNVYPMTLLEDDVELTFALRGQCSALLFVGPTLVRHHTMRVTVHDRLFVGPFPRAACVYLL